MVEAPVDVAGNPKDMHAIQLGLTQGSEYSPLCPCQTVLLLIVLTVAHVKPAPQLRAPEGASSQDGSAGL